MPGVIAVLNGKQMLDDGIGNLICGWMIHSKDGTPMKMGAWRPLAHETVRYVGDAVAIVVADSVGEARDAAEAVVVDYEVLPAVTDAVTALKAGQPQLHPEAPGNLIYDWEIGDSAAVKLREREWFYRPVVGAWAPVSEAPAYVPPRTRPPSQERHENATQARTDEEWLRSVREQVARARAETYERVWRGALVRLDAEKHRAEDLHALDLDTMPATLDTLKAAWRTTARRHHPDAGGDASRFARSKAAYDRLTEALEKTP